MPTNKEPDELRRISDWPRRWLEHRYLPWHQAVLAMVLCAPPLWLGWPTDDHFLRSALTRPDLPMISRSPAERFAFIKTGGPGPLDLGGHPGRPLAIRY